MTKLLILGKDGTLVRPKSGARFVQHPEDQELLPGVIEALAMYAAEGWTIAIASNQGGVAAGFKKLDSAIGEMRYCMKLTGIRMAYMAHSDERWYGEMISLYHPECSTEISWSIHTDKKLRFRKPNCGMLFAAINWGHMEPITETLYVGDRPEDEAAAKAANIPFQWAHEWRG